MKYTNQALTAVVATTVLCTSSTNAFSIGSKMVSSHSVEYRVLPQARSMSPSATTTATSLSATSSTNQVDDEVQRLKAMAAKLKQEAAELEARQVSERAQAVDKAFDKFDTNKDGVLSLDELKAALEKTFKLDVPEERVRRLIQDIDSSGDGALQRDEFVSLEQLRNRMESLAYEEKQKALEATKTAQQEAELSKLLEAQMEMVNDKPPTATDKIVSVLPYLFPLMDSLVFGQHLLAGNESNPLVAALALLFVTYKSIPFSGFLAFFALSSFSGNLSVNRLVRFNMQQAIFLDVALFVPGLLGALAAGASSGLGLNLPPMVAQMSGDAIFISLLAVIGYSAVSSLLGVTPDKVPGISQAVNNRLPTADMIQFINPTTGEPILKNKDKKDEENKKENQDKEN